MDTRTSTTATTTIDGLLPLLWLASPALPVGGFSYSEGLEAAVDAGLVTGEAQAADWLVHQLHLNLARADLVVVRNVVADPAQADAMNAWVLRTRETSELRQQTVQMGRSMLEWLKSVGRAVPHAGPLAYPVAWSLAASGFELGARDALNAFAFGWAENMVQAAVRVVPLGQSSGQRILSRLAQEIPAAVDAAFAAEEPQAFSPMLAILSSRHETQYSRLFRS
ncbi:urease accessory protein UreF [Ramlibacter sp. PS4R-6]|uniref:urease accessory protein UreF n=1 Tax=Ramlibacter sp. PS4R-6 TaxID=3133438 RepID=UPI0030960654